MRTLSVFIAVVSPLLAIVSIATLNGARQHNPPLNSTWWRDGS